MADWGRYRKVSNALGVSMPKVSKVVRKVSQGIKNELGSESIILNMMCSFLLHIFICILAFLDTWVQ